SSFFSAVGLRPELGRAFTPEDDLPGNHVAILDHSEWLSYFGGDPAVVGRTVKIDGEPTTIIGVMPQQFSSLFLWGPTNIFRPMAFTDAEKQDHSSYVLQLVGRTDTASSLSQTNARLATVAAQIAQHRAIEFKNDGLKAVTLQSTASNKSTALVLGI